MKIQWTAATELFNSRYRERGTEIYDSGGVLSLDWIERSDTSARIHSTVRGSQNQIYAQVILIKERSHFPDVQGDCSCPVGHNCKHVVAVIRAITREDKSTRQGVSASIATPVLNEASRLRIPTAPVPREAPLPYEVDVWLSRLEQAQLQKHDEYPEGVTQRLFYVFE